MRPPKERDTNKGGDLTAVEPIKQNEQNAFGRFQAAYGAGTDRVIRKPEVQKIVGLSDATIWRLERRGEFPKRIQLGGNSVGWLLSEVLAWLKMKAQER